MTPIKMAFVKLKTLLRQAPQRTRDGLWNRIGELLDRFTQPNAPTTSKPPAMATDTEKCCRDGADPMSRGAA